MAARTFEHIDSRPDPVGLYPWLLVMIGPFGDLFNGEFDPAWPAAVGLVAFPLLFARVLWSGLRGGRPKPYLLFGVLTLLTFGLAIGYGGTMDALFPLLALVCGGIMPWDERPIAPNAVLVLSVTAAGPVLVRDHSLGGAWQVLYGSALAGFVTALIFHLIGVIAVLRETREELAQAAVENERLRFARDLHDLLGHTLSVMVVKAQAVRRLKDPVLVAEQAADIESIGREALKEVREAVTGYRGRGITAELDGAATTLSGAGITATLRQEGMPPAPEADALLGWVIRESVTNVIRHSGARTCTITVRGASVEIADDGTNLPGVQGYGLRGLSERVAAAGGELSAAPRPDGGFRVAVSLPE